MGGLSALALVVLVFGFLGISFYGATKRKVIYEKYKGCFSPLKAYIFLTFSLLGAFSVIGGLAAAIIRAVTKTSDGGRISEMLSTAAFGAVLFAIAMLLGKNATKKAKIKGLTGAKRAMLLAGLGTAMAIVLKVIGIVLPIAGEIGERQHQQYLAEQAELNAKQQEIDNSRVYNSSTDESYYLNSDGTRFKTPDGEWHNINEVNNSDNLSLKQD